MSFSFLESSRMRRPHDTAGRQLHDLRISVMDRCNFRCRYCMPRETFHENYRFLTPGERLSFEEIARITRLFVRQGVRKVRLTGGEPLLRKNVADLVGELTAIEGVQDVALTTNGVLLAQHAVELKAKGLQRITVSLDTLDAEIFKQMTGGMGDLDRVLDGIRAAREAGLAPIKINSVIERGVNDHHALDLVEHFRGTGVIVRFIEYMDVGNRNRWSLERVVPSRELVDRIGQHWPLHPVDANYRGEVAERYAFDDGLGEIGFISSITNPFCGDCTRGRLSSEGVFYTCLFARSGVDLRAPLRAGVSDAELSQLIHETWLKRSDRYSEIRSTLSDGERPFRKIEMHYIGG